MLGDIAEEIGRIFAKEAASRIFRLVFGSVGVFNEGGTVEANLLAGLDYKMPTMNVAAIEGLEKVSQPSTTQVYNLSSTFVTPDVDSFKASEYQIQQEQLEQLRRMNGRS